MNNQTKKTSCTCSCGADKKESIKEKAEHAAHVAKENLTEAAHTVKEKLSEAAHTAEETAQKAKDRLKELVD